MCKNSISGINVLSLIPQRAPIIMIDALEYADEKTTISTFTVKDSCIFCNNGYLSESGVLENIAQTGAAGFGYSSIKDNKPVPLGFIASIKNITIHSLPPINVTIKTEVITLEPVLGFTIIKGKTKLNDLVIATCEMRIFIKPSI